MSGFANVPSSSPQRAGGNSATRRMASARSWRTSDFVRLAVVPALVCVVALGFALWNPMVDQGPYAPPGSGVVLLVLTVAVALVTEWMRRRLALEFAGPAALPDPFYVLYFAAIVLVSSREGILLAIATPLVCGMAVSGPVRARVPASLGHAAIASASAVVAAIVYNSAATALLPILIRPLHAHLTASLLAALVLLAGASVSHLLDLWPPQTTIPAYVLGYFRGAAFRLQALMLVMGPLLPLAEVLDDTEAELAWMLFVVPLSAIYYLALVSARLQQRTLELQGTVTALAVARRREVELTDYAALITRAQEEERRRLARELHDDTAQALVALSRGLDTMLSHAHAGGSDLHSARAADVHGETRFLEDLGELAKRTLDSIRRACQDLRPSVLDDLGLPAALESLCGAMSQRGLACTFQQRGELIVCTREAEVTVYRIVQEALSNSLHHAQAAMAVVALEYVPGEPGSLRVDVTDDGCGFDYAAVLEIDRSGGLGNRRAGLGLIGMRERAALIGASLSVNTAPGQGTHVSLVVPAVPGARVLV